MNITSKKEKCPPTQHHIPPPCTFLDLHMCRSVTIFDSNLRMGKAEGWDRKVGSDLATTYIIMGLFCLRMHPPWGLRVQGLSLNLSNLADARHGQKKLCHTTVATSTSFERFLTFMKIYTSGYGFFYNKKLEKIQFWFHKKTK